MIFYYLVWPQYLSLRTSPFWLHDLLFPSSDCSFLLCPRTLFFSSKPLDGSITLGSTFGSSPDTEILLITYSVPTEHLPKYVPLSQSTVPLDLRILLDSHHLADFHSLGKIWLELHLLCDPSLMYSEVHAPWIFSCSI